MFRAAAVLACCVALATTVSSAPATGRRLLESDGGGQAQQVEQASAPRAKVGKMANFDELAVAKQQKFRIDEKSRSGAESKGDWSGNRGKGYKGTKSMMAAVKVDRSRSNTRTSSAFGQLSMVYVVGLVVAAAIVGTAAAVRSSGEANPETSGQTLRSTASLGSHYSQRDVLERPPSLGGKVREAPVSLSSTPREPLPRPGSSPSADEDIESGMRANRGYGTRHLVSPLGMLLGTRLYGSAVVEGEQ